MPDVDGVELLRHIRAEPTLRDVPVVSAFWNFVMGRTGARAPCLPSLFLLTPTHHLSLPSPPLQ